MACSTTQRLISVLWSSLRIQLRNTAKRSCGIQFSNLNTFNRSLSIMVALMFQSRLAMDTGTESWSGTGPQLTSPNVEPGKLRCQACKGLQVWTSPAWQQILVQKAGIEPGLQLTSPDSEPGKLRSQACEGLQVTLPKHNKTQGKPEKREPNGP